MVLFTGLGADQRLLEPQRDLPYELITPGWIEPAQGQTLPEYARRMAAGIDWPDRCLLGGVSFGGMIAAELAPQVKPDALLLIASCLSARSIPSMFRFLNALGKAVPDAAIRLSGGLSRRFVNLFGDFSDEVQLLLADMLRRASVNLLRRAGEMALAWPGAPQPPCPRLWIHGGRDLVIPLPKVNPDVVIPGGGHLINWTHAEQVNRLIRSFVERLG